MRKLISLLLIIVVLCSINCYVACASDTHFEITDISYTDTNFNKLTSIAPGDRIYISVTSKKVDSAQIHPLVVTAVYNEEGKPDVLFTNKSLIT